MMKYAEKIMIAMNRYWRVSEEKVGSMTKINQYVHKRTHTQ